MLDVLNRYLREVRPTASVLTLILIALIALFFIRYHREMAPRMGTLEWIRNYDRPKFTLDGRRHPMERKDVLPLVVLLAVYAVVKHRRASTPSQRKTMWWRSTSGRARTLHR